MRITIDPEERGEGNSYARYSSAVGRFLPAFPGDIVQLGRIDPRSIELDVVRTLARSTMPVVHGEKLGNSSRSHLRRHTLCRM